jgi:hypothetical protein
VEPQPHLAQQNILLVLPYASDFLVNFAMLSYFRIQHGNPLPRLKLVAANGATWLRLVVADGATRLWRLIVADRATLFRRLVAADRATLLWLVGQIESHCFGL